MCGIVAIAGREPVVGRLLRGLRNLEYRGYDSAGVATLDNGGAIHQRRAVGKVRALEAVLAGDPITGATGIAHTRWATHGAPTLANAHPHKAGRVTVAHNGIIENFAGLKRELQARGRAFGSDTDTEVVAHLLDEQLASGGEPLAALKVVLDQLEGAFALAILIDGHEDLVLGARRGSPLVIGHGKGEMYLGSDALALGHLTRRLTYLEDGDYVAITRLGAAVFDADGDEIQRPSRIVDANSALVEKGAYRHFMEKEIHEQPASTQQTLSAYVNPVSRRARAPDGINFKALNRIQILACGTAFYAGMVARYAFERIARLPVDLEIASEFRYRHPAVAPGTLALAVSQSGETADTLAALRWCKKQGLQTAALVNVHTSSMAREAGYMLPTHAGPEIGVASTKAFTAQVSALLALAVAAGVQRGVISGADEAAYVDHLLEAPRLITEALTQDRAIQAVSQELAHARSVVYLARGAMCPLALEGALKLKEITYVHAEGYAAGELKHGPIALIDELTPVVVLAPDDELFDKTASNLQEVAARGGRVLLITSATHKVPEGAARWIIQAPPCDPLIAPLVYAILIQLLAYHTAVRVGTNVDQPRNLAKSVTVE